MHKIIKKILYLSGWAFFLVVFLGILASLLINTSGVQNYITSKTLGKLENKFGNHFDYSKVRYRLFNRIDFTELLISDLSNDTIIYAPELRANFPGLIRNVIFKKELPVKIGALSFENSYFRLYVDSTQTDNIKFLFDTLQAHKDTSKGPTPIFFDKITIKNSKFALLKYDTTFRPEGIDFSRIIFNDLDIKVKDLMVFADTLKMDINRLSFNEKSGFRVKSFGAQLHICSQFLKFSDVEMELKESQLALSRIDFDFNQFKDFGGGNVFQKVKLHINLEQSAINMKDLGYFAPIFSDMDHEIRLQGNFYGPLAEFNARNLLLNSGNTTLLKGQFDMSGLPDIPSTFLFFDIEEFVTDVIDIQELNLPNKKKIRLPDVFRNINTLRYKGNFTGFFRDFVSYGEITTEHGNVMTDVLFAPDSNNQVSFSGKLNTNYFNIGVFTKSSSDVFGGISLNMDIDGQGLIDGGFDVDMRGKIRQFEINKYTYTNINVDGNFSENRFNGKLQIDDPNAKLEFDGLVDLSSEIRQYIFSANVYYANLFNLNFHKKDTNYSSSFLINANLSGNSIDEINGNVKLLNSLFSNSNAQIQVYDLQLDIRNDSMLNELVLHSDFMDGKIYGKFQPTQIIDEYLSLSSRLLPSLPIRQKNELSELGCDFKYSLLIKNSLPIFNYFSPNYSFHPGTQIDGVFKRDSVTKALVHLTAPEITLNNTFLKSVTMNTTVESDSLSLNVGCQIANVNNRFVFDNLTIESNIDSNNVRFSSRWINWDSLLFKGAISGVMNFHNMPGQKLISDVTIDSSAIVINDSLWAFNKFGVRIDSSSIHVDNFKISHGNEALVASGWLTEGKGDSLLLSFNKFDFSNLNSFTRSDKFKFAGILDGGVSVKGYKKPLIFAEMVIEGLALNDELLGDTYLETYWENKRESLVIDADVFRGKLNTLNLKGEIFPTRGSEMDLTLNFNKFRLNFVNPYLDNIFDDIKGLATGKVSLSGTTAKPKVNGSLNLQKAALTVDYLNTRYNFTSELGVSNNNLVFDNILLYDEFGNSASLNGLIRTEYFKSYNLNLSIRADKFLFLNTTEVDNEAYYGQAFATGLVRINGEPSSLKIDVSARTEAGTDFKIPLSDSEELTEYTFIKFIDFDTLNTTKEEDEKYDVNLTGMQLDFDLKITPEAKVKIIFDPTMGDVIEATGSGEMRIAINTLGDFKILGEYNIEQGDYLFTLKDVLINKKFKVQQGSSLRWTGDPINADIDIETYYRTKASLKDLDNTFESIGSTTVDCQLELSGKLMKPNVGYDINLPYAEQEVKDKVSSRIVTEEEKGKQFLSLLILNRFFYDGTGDDQEGNLGGSNIAGVNASELLSNQLSNWLSQISNDFDVGVHYRPGTELSPQEVEVALSTQLLNDRLSINGSVDMKTNAEVEQANTIVGDVDIDYKITRNGKIRARVFNRANEEDQVANYSKYTQGLGIFYTEEFNKFSEVTTRYKNSFKNRKKKDKKDSEQQNEEPIDNKAVREEDE